MVYCTYNMLNMFRALLCPSLGARDYIRLWCAMCVGSNVDHHHHCICSSHFLRLHLQVQLKKYFWREANIHLSTQSGAQMHRTFCASVQVVTGRDPAACTFSQMVAVNLLAPELFFLILAHPVYKM